jgi:hypothetical protein
VTFMPLEHLGMIDGVPSGVQLATYKVT